MRPTLAYEDCVGSFGPGPVDPQFAHLLPQVLAADAEPRRRFGHAPAVLLERAGDELALTAAQVGIERLGTAAPGRSIRRPSGTDPKARSADPAPGCTRDRCSA